MNRTQRTIGLASIGVLALLSADAPAYHAPQLGRFVQRDRAGYVDGMSLSEHQRSRPTVLTDPGGERSEKWGMPPCTCCCALAMSLEFRGRHPEFARAAMTGLLAWRLGDDYKL